MSRMQCEGRKNRSPLDHVITLNAIIEKQRLEKKPTYVFFADAEKCFDKLWLEDGQLQLHRQGWSEKDVMMLFRLHHIKTSTQDFTITNIIKQGTTHGPIICCAETSRVNNSEEPVKYQYEQVKVGDPVFMDDHDDVTKAVKSCRNIGTWKKQKYSHTV